MVTQKLTIRLDESELPEIRMVSGDIGREIQIEVYAREDSVNPIDLETYSAEITLIKPDNTFIMDNFTNDKYELPEQAGAVSGSGYYQIKIFTAGDHQIYTGQGPFLVDDMILSDDVIESSSIAFGDCFPEDFATKTWVDEEIEHAGLGTYVEGNPAGDPTESDLLKLQINDDIFPIPVPVVPESLDDLDDVDISGPADGEVLMYDGSKWENAELPEPPSVTKTATGNPIEITDGADAPLVKCVTQITGYQSGTGTPSPDNVRPIVAYTEGEIEVRGVNVWDEEWESGYINTATGAKVSDPTKIRTKNPIPVMPNTTYFYVTPVAMYICSYDVDMNFLQRLGGSKNTTITTPANCKYLMFGCESAYGTTYNHDISINYPATVTTYEPYKGTTHTTTYPSAIYRGSEDVVSGEVTTEWGMIASYAGETLPGEWISDRDEYAPGTTPTTGAQVAYELAAPTTAAVTPTNLPIKSLSGYNHIESSTGDMEVEYITQQYAPLQHLHYYSTAEQVLGKWVDGSDVKEKTYIYMGTGAANPFTATIDMTGKSIIEVIPHYAKYTYGGGTVGYCAGSKLTESNSSVLKVEYDDATPPTVNVTSYLGSSTETYEIAFTIRYI